MTQMIQTAGGRVAYEVYGSGGTPVVAVPGIGDTRASYRVLAPHLASAGFTVYAMDLRGHGESDAGFGSYTSEDIGDDVVALLDQQDLRGAVLLGNSVGGAAIAHAALSSDRVASLVMLSAFLRDPPNFALVRVMLGAMFMWPWGVAAWASYRKTLFKTPPADMAANHAEVIANLRETGRLAAVRSMMRASKASIAARTPGVRVPALIAMGAQDPDFTDPAEEAQAQVAQLGGECTIAMIDQAGHYPQIERPQQTAQAILRFLGHDAPDGS